MNVQELQSNETSYSCWNKTAAQKSAYWIAVALVVGGIVLGALILISQKGNIPMGEGMDQIIDGLGKYTAAPLASSCGLLTILMLIGYAWSTSDGPSTLEQEIEARQKDAYIALQTQLESGITLPQPELDQRLRDAAYEGHVDMVKLLLKKGADPTSTHELDGSITIHLALQGENWSKSKLIIDVLIQSVPELINFRDNNGDTPLHVAVKGKEALEKVLYLMLLGADFNAEGSHDLKPIHAALVLSDDEPTPSLDLIELLLKQSKLSLEEIRAFEELASRRPELYTSLRERKLITTLKARFERGDKLEQSELDQLLHDSIGEGNVEMVISLLKNKANPNATNVLDGSTTLHLALQVENWDKSKQIIDALIQLVPALINYPRNDGKTPLCLAVTGTDALEKVQYLQQLGADCTITDNQGLKPIHFAVWPSATPSVELIDHLLENSKLNLKEMDQFIKLISQHPESLMKDMLMKKCGIPNNQAHHAAGDPHPVL